MSFPENNAVNMKGELVYVDPKRLECPIKNGVHVNPCGQCTGCTNIIGAPEPGFFKRGPRGGR